MNILVYGAGVIGSIFAGKLALSGQNVTMLARGGRIEELKSGGVVLMSPRSGKTETAGVNVIEKLLPDMEFDYIFVVMQRTQVASVLPDLSQNCSKNIVFVVNTASGYEEWVQAIGAQRLMLGFPSAGGERSGVTVSYFVGKGAMRMFQTTTFGEYSGKRTERVTEVIRMFRKAGIPSVYSGDMDAWQKTHVAMVTSIANALYKYDTDNYRLAKSYKDVSLMVRGIKEGFAVLRKLGIKTAPAKLCFFRLPAPMLGVAFKLFMGSQLAEVTMSKHCRSARPELAMLQSEVNALIDKSGMNPPSIEELRKYQTI